MTLHEALATFTEFAGKVYHRETPGDLQDGFTVVYDLPAQNVQSNDSYATVSKVVVLQFWHKSTPQPKNSLALINLANKVCTRLGNLVTEDHMGQIWPKANNVFFDPPLTPIRDQGAWFVSARGRVNTVWREV